MLSSEEIATLVAALPLSFVVMQAGGSVYRRLRSSAVAQCVARISAMIMADEEPTDGEMRALRSRYSAGVVLDSVLFVAEKIYGDRLNRLVLIIEVCALDYYLLGMIRRSRGLRRVRNLSKLSLLTNATMVVEYAEVYMEESHRLSRFYAMAALVSARPNRAIRYIERFDEALSLYEVAILAQLMRRAGVAIAYTPMLVSQNRNLQLVGIYLCEHFSITDSEPHLQLLAESDDREIAYMALQAICAIRGDISTVEVGEALQQFMPHQRTAFIMRAVQNCYSLRSCAHYLSPDEREIFLQRQNSYKCRMVCN